MNPALFKEFFPEDVVAYFTGSSADFNLAGDAQGLSEDQKQFLSQFLYVNPHNVYTMRQVHGNNVLIITTDDFPQNDHLPEADAMITNSPGIFLSVRTADCLPVFLYDPKVKCIGLVHAGWKSSAHSIVVKTLALMARNYGSQAVDVRAAFGPAIRACCYEVGREFLQTFPNEIENRADRLYVNLSLVNRKQLLGAGIQGRNIFDVKQCTVCGQGFFSFRRDKENAGRHLSLLALREDSDGSSNSR